MNLLLVRFAVALTVSAAMSGAALAADAAAAPSPAAAPARTYAIVSLIGDQFEVVARRVDPGTRLDPNEHTPLQVPDAVFDQIAAAEAERVLLKAQPGLPVLRASIRDPRLFALQEKLLEESDASHDMRIALHDLLAKSGATDLILITKHRGEAMFKVVTGKISGGGQLTGLGFYMDNRTHMFNTRSRQQGEGFLAPYAYLMVSHIDLASMRLVNSKPALEQSMALPVDKDGAARAWDALGPKEKVNALERAIRRAVDTAMADDLVR